LVHLLSVWITTVLRSSAFSFRLSDVSVSLPDLPLPLAVGLPGRWISCSHYLETSITRCSESISLNCCFNFASMPTRLLADKDNCYRPPHTSCNSSGLSSLSGDTQPRLIRVDHADSNSPGHRQHNQAGYLFISTSTVLPTALRPFSNASPRNSSATSITTPPSSN
jgi:hypothetical protein